VSVSGLWVDNDDGSGESCPVPDHTWTGLSLGWLPG